VANFILFPSLLCREDVSKMVAMIFVSFSALNPMQTMIKEVVFAFFYFLFYFYLFVLSTLTTQPLSLASDFHNHPIILDSLFLTIHSFIL